MGDKVRTITLAFLSVLVIFTPLQTADAEWAHQMSIAGDGNDIIGVAAGTGLAAVAVGVVKGGQGSEAKVFVTTDGGAKWNQLPAPSQLSFMLSVSMSDSKTVYGAGLGLFKSTSGGQSFSPISIPGSGAFTSYSQVSSTDPYHAYAVSGSKLFYTPNGQGWTSTDTGMDVELTSVFFLNSLTGWVAGGKADKIEEVNPQTGQTEIVGYDYKPNGTVLKTVDGGKTFEPVTMYKNEYFQKITFVTDLIGLAVASSNDRPYYLKRTTDGGKSWSDIELPKHPSGRPFIHLSRAAMTSLFQAWIAGSVGEDGGGVMNKAVILRSMDGGVTWDFDKSAEKGGTYYDIAFAGPHWGFAVGDWGKIAAYTDGTPWKDPEQPDKDVVEQPDGYSDEDVFSWGNLIGTFGDDVLVGKGGQPGGWDGGDQPGGGINIGKGCKEVERSTGCAFGSDMGGAGRQGVMPAFLPLLGLMALLLGRFLGSRSGGGSAKSRSLSLLPAVVTALLWFSSGCGGSETVLECPDVQGLPPLSGNDLGTAEEEDSAPGPQNFECVLKEGVKPIPFAAEKRDDTNNDFIVFVGSNTGGGSDLFLSTTDGKQRSRLTWFDSPDVEVSSPVWTPDRKAVAFLSNYRAAFNQYPWNIFVISLEGQNCHQVTPGIDGTRAYPQSSLKGTVTGLFKYGQGAIAAPVADAVVTFPGGSKAHSSGKGGEFSIPVPPGEGIIVLRGAYSGLNLFAVAPYNVESGATQDLGSIMGTVEPEYSLSRLSIAGDGSRAFVLVKSQLKGYFSIDTTTGEMTQFLHMDEDSLAIFAPFPNESLAAATLNSAPEQVVLLDLLASDDEKWSKKVKHDFEFPGLTTSSAIAISPHRFLATVQGDSVIVMGVGKGGDLETRDVTPKGTSGFQPEQLDWSLDGQKIVVTVVSKGKSNILIVDANSGATTPVTTDGGSSMPAWFGR